MKRIIEFKKLFNIEGEINLGELKITYRNLIKEWHPDKFVENDDKKVEAESKSKTIIEAYNFLVSISPETKSMELEEYTLTANTSGIDGFVYKGQALKITFLNGSVYEYFGVPKNIYTKLVNSPIQSRFARRHIFHSFVYRNISKSMVEKN